MRTVCYTLLRYQSDAPPEQFNSIQLQRIKLYLFEQFNSIQLQLIKLFLFATFQMVV